MTSGTAHPSQTGVHETTMHVFTWVASMIGLLAAALGGWIMVAPDNGTITVNGRTWAASDLTESWGPWLLIVGGAAAAIGMAYAAVRDRRHRASWWLVSAEFVLAVVGVAAAVAGIVALI